MEALNAINLSPEPVPRAELQLYFECFPSSYVEFVDLFGYEMIGVSAVFAPLFRDGEQYFAVLPRVRRVVAEDRYVGKLVGIAEGASWQADSVNELKQELGTLLRESPQLVLREVDKRGSDFADDFWRFYFSGPHGYSGEAEDLARRSCSRAFESHACDGLRRSLQLPHSPDDH